jgi:iron complex transport system ATP-binding protein
VNNLKGESSIMLTSTDLSLSYESASILEHLDIGIEQGEIVSLVGPNGCGKSTLLRGLARLLRPSGGAVCLDGKEIHQLPTRELARKIGVLPQNASAPEGLTVHELVAQGRFPHQSWLRQWSEEDERATQEALRITHMQQMADRPIDTLSGGQRQRAWIAMALAQDTDILLLDEPTTFLDMAYQLDVLDLARRLNREKGMTIVLVLHDLNQAARYTDRMIVLGDGHVVADGTPQEVLTPEMLAAVFGVAVNIVIDPASGTPVCLPHTVIAERPAVTTAPEPALEEMVGRVALPAAEMAK